MKVEKKYFKGLDVLRILSCIGVLLYHFGYLKGGFLSVCCFFVLSGYLSYVSLSKYEKVNLLEFYKNRFLHIYLPFILVVFLSLCAISFLPDTHWFNLKPETTSVLFGYNNYWQLSVNSDYFARHLNSPFMHFWYIAILLQFEIVFPFLFILIKKLKEKTKRFIPLIILILLMGASLVYFYYSSMQENIMIAYYDSLARVFSLLLGVIVGYISLEYHPLVIPFPNKIFSRILFCFYLLIFIVLQFLVDSSSSYFAIMMIVSSLLTCRMIDYGTIESSSELNSFEKAFKYLSGVSYEVYLFQYPVIFIFQYLTITESWKLPIMIFVIILLSYFLHFCLDLKDLKGKYIRIVCLIIVSLFSLYGLVQYVIAKDHTEEMNQLETQLNENQKLLETKQKEYAKRLQEESAEWDTVLSNLEHGEEELKSYVANLPIVGVGDSVMLGAVPSLYEQFPNGYFDAKVSRTDYEANGILQYVKNQGLLADNIVIHLGTNGQCGVPCQEQIIETCEGRTIYWLTVSNDMEVHVNNGFYQLAERHPNVKIVDWAGVSSSHPEYFVADGIHLTGSGMIGYRETIYNAIYKTYYDEYQKKKETVLKEHEEKEKQKISFYGNDLLLNIYDSIQKDFVDSSFKIDSEATFDTVYEEIKKDIESNNIHHRVVLLMDSIDGCSKESYLKLVELEKDLEFTFVFVHNSPYSFKEENVHTIDFSKEIRKKPEYLMVDGIHLSDQGNNSLEKLLKEELLNKKKD